MHFTRENRCVRPVGLERLQSAQGHRFTLTQVRSSFATALNLEPYALLLQVEMDRPLCMSVLLRDPKHAGFLQFMFRLLQTSERLSNALPTIMIMSGPMVLNRLR